MKKNSKVMNVLMSLFLVMGMLFQVTPVRAEGEPEQGTTENLEGSSHYTVRFVEGSWSDAPNIVIDEKVVTRNTITIDDKEYLRFEEDDPLLSYVLDSTKTVEGYAYEDDNHKRSTFSLNQLKQGIEINGNVNMFPVRSYTITFYKEDKENYTEESNVHAQVRTGIHIQSTDAEYLQFIIKHYHVRPLEISL